jgi:ferredoxin-nitrite reductase
MFDTKPIRDVINKFTDGEVDARSYKSFSGGYGTYSQRGGKLHMIRLRLTGGEINPQQMSFISDVVKKYNIDLIHGTTCQTIQLHNLSPESVIEIMEGAQNVGIFTKAGGGDNPRNVMCSPLTGVAKDDYFDVMPYVKATADYLLNIADEIKMPRKLKVCFSSSPKNEVHATFRDLGFVAGKNGLFDVYSAGGLGNGPKIGLLTAKGVDPADTLYYIRAMILTFLEHGNYENRMKARTRFMREALGDEEYINQFNKNLEIAKKENLPEIKINNENKKVGIKGDFNNTRVIEQNTDGLYSVFYHPLGSNIPPETVHALAKAMNDYNSVMRIVPSGGFYIINLTAPEAEKVLEITSGSGTTPIEFSTACIGSIICQQGLQNSQALLADIVNAVKRANISANALPSVHISGCTSSCGSHQTNVIGFQGRIKKDENGTMQPAFAVFIGGSDEKGSENLGESSGIVFAKDVPDMLVEIGKRVDENNVDFMSWYKNNADELKNIVEKYC